MALKCPSATKSPVPIYWKLITLINLLTLAVTSGCEAEVCRYNKHRVLASGCPRNTQDWSDRWSEVSAIEGWWNWLTGISKRLPTTIQSTIHLWLTAMPERRFRYHCTNPITEEAGSRETMSWSLKYQLLDYLLAAVYGSTKGITTVSTKVNKM